MNRYDIDRAILLGLKACRKPATRSEVTNAMRNCKREARAAAAEEMLSRGLVTITSAAKEKPGPAAKILEVTAAGSEEIQRLSGFVTAYRIEGKKPIWGDA